MSWKRRPTLSAALLCLGLSCATAAGGVQAGLCEDNQALLDYADDDRVASDYFDAYFIARHGKVYHIHARKRVELDFATLLRVMETHEEHPDFMPGYRWIEVVRNPDGETLTALRFRSTFSPFTSRFTTLVETSAIDREYQQCWRQLEPDDPRVIEEFSNAPRVNQGIWRFVILDDGTVEMNYFSLIRPPVSIPSWLYKNIVKGTYQEVFEKIILRARGSV